MSTVGSDAIDLSVVIPVFNELPYIENVLRSWLQHLRSEGLRFEMIVVNDGSLDGTGRVLDRIRRDHGEVRILHQLNVGQARALLRGYERAKGPYVLSLDGNAHHMPDVFRPLWNQRTRAALVLGVARKATPLLRRLVALEARSLLRTKLADPGAPLRLYRRDRLEGVLRDVPRDDALAVTIALRLAGEVLETEVTMGARRRHPPFSRARSQMRWLFACTAEITTLSLSRVNVSLFHYVKERIRRSPARS